MSLFEAIILGIVQGISEFLPISSTGHLTLAGKLMSLIDDAHPEQWTAFIAVIQLGTLVSILAYFWKDIINIIAAFFKDNITERKSFKHQSFNSRLGWMVIIGTIPVVVVGLGFKKIIEGALTKNLWVIAGSLAGVAVILALAEYFAKHKKEMEEVTIKDAIIVGIAQCFALIPGSSRSGTTLIAAEKCSRICYGIELEPLYIDTAIRRWEELTGKDAIQLESGKNYKELLEIKKGEMKDE